MRHPVLWLVGLALLGGCTQNSVKDVQEPGERSPAMINVELGVGYMREGRNELALAKLRKALEQDPRLPMAHNMIAFLYERLGEDGLARDHYERALSLDSDDASAHNNYGQFLCLRGELEKAERHFSQSFDNPLYKTPERPLTNAGICARRIPDLAKAEDYLRRALRANPRYAPALLQMADLSYRSDNALSARGYLQRYLAVAPHNAETLWLGVQVEDTLDNRDAVASYSLLLKGKFPDAPQTQMLLKWERGK